MIEHLPLPPDSAILSDRIGFLPARRAKSRRNPMQNAVREVRVLTETGKELRILSNDLDAPAQEIADLYKRRWQIELFFRWIKQILKITRFLGTSENAVRIQVAVALIAYLLLRLAHATHAPSPAPPPSPNSSAQISCTGETSTTSSSLQSPSPATRAKHKSNAPQREPDRRGLPPTMTVRAAKDSRP